jgi:hypothetical protein
MIAMTSAVFLKRIRQLGYDRLYDDEKLKPKVVANLIYAMATKIGKAELTPTQAQQELADRSNKMPTTLWFENDEQFRDVFACGQNSIVHALLRWMERGNKDAEGEVTSRLREMWKLLQENPFRFVPAVRGGAGGTVAPLSAGVASPETAPARPTRETA